MQGRTVRRRLYLPWERLRHQDWTLWGLFALTAYLVIASVPVFQKNHETEVDPILKQFKGEQVR